jgi:hypothetical protein
MDAEKGFAPQQDDTSVPVADEQVIGVPGGTTPTP